MSTTLDKAAQAAEDAAKNDSAVEETKTPPTLAELAREAKSRDGSEVDVPRVEKAISAFVTTFGPFWKASQEVALLKSKLGDLLMEIRLTITLSNGKPDFYGTSWAYRYVFADRIKGMLKTEYGMTESQAGDLLDTVRVNYVNRNEMVAETVIRQAVHTGELKNATITPDGVVTIKNVSKAGKETVQEYKPGQTSGVPSAIASIVSKVQKDAGKKVAPRFGGAANGTGGRNKETEQTENPAAEMRAALALLVSLAKVAPLEAIQGFYEATTALGDNLLGAPDAKAPETLTGGKAEVALALLPWAEYVKSVSAALAGQGTKDEANALRYTPAES